MAQYHQIGDMRTLDQERKQSWLQKATVQFHLYHLFVQSIQQSKLSI